MALSLAQQEQLSMFITMTRSNTDTAISFLKEASWNMEVAMDRYYAFNGDLAELTSFNSNTNKAYSEKSTLINQLQNESEVGDWLEQAKIDDKI